MNIRRYYVVNSNGFMLRADGKNGRSFGGLMWDHSAHPVPRAAFSSRAYAVQAARDFGLRRNEFWVVSTVGEI